MKRLKLLFPPSCIVQYFPSKTGKFTPVKAMVLLRMVLQLRV